MRIAIRFARSHQFMLAPDEGLAQPLQLLKALATVVVQEQTADGQCVKSTGILQHS